jgi:hypothetical protein
MIKTTHQRLLLVIGAIVAVIMILIYRFGYIPFSVCPEVIPKLLIPCTGLMNTGIQLGSVLILSVITFLLLKRLNFVRPLLVSLLALLLIWELSDLVFWPGTYWISLVIYTLLGATLFPFANFYFNKWKTGMWIKISLAVLLVGFLFIFAPLVQMNIDRQLMMSTY